MQNTPEKKSLNRRDFMAGAAVAIGTGKKAMSKGTLPSQFNEWDVVASICRESFYEFVREFWEVVIPEAPIWNWHIKYLCDEMQTVAERVFRNEPAPYDLIINISPGSTKSTICSVMFPAWVWTRMITARCLCASFSHPLALDLSRKSRDIVESDKYLKCFPDIELRTDQNTKTDFQNMQGGLRYAVGRGGAVTGRHGHFLIVDDPIDPQEGLSEADRKAANTWVGETFSSRTVDKQVTVMIMVMQRLHQDDPTGNRLAKKKGRPVKHICIPAEITEHVNPPELKAFYKDNLMDPNRLPEHILRMTEEQIGQYGYAGQYLQNPVPLGGGMFKVDKISIAPIDESKMKRVVRYWDKAGTAGGGMYTVGVKMAMDKDSPPHFYVLDVIRGQWESSRREAIIMQTAKLDGRRVHIGVEQEPGSSGKESAEATQRRLYGFKVVADKVTGDKEERADPFSVQVNSGNVTVREGADWAATWLEELRYFPMSTYKDQVDASSGAFAMLCKKRYRLGAF